MLKNQKINYRQNSYNTSDSGIMFLLALVIPQFLMIAITLICSSATGLPFSSVDPNVKTFVDTYPTLYTVLCGIVPQVGMLISFFFLSERKKIHYAKANQIHLKNFNWIVILIVLAIGVVCLLGFTPFVNWFDHIVEGWGYTSSTANIDVGTVGKFIGAVFYIGLLPAIVEELVFRGVITNGIKEKGIKTAVLFSAILFAVMHQNLQQFVYQLFLGGVMAYIVLKTGNILYTMLLHFFNNFVVLLDSHLNGGKTPKIDYSNAWNNIYPFLLVILTVAVVIGLLFLLNFVLKKQKTKQSNSQLEVQQAKNNNEQSIGKQKNQIETNCDLTLQIKDKVDAKKSPLKNPYFVAALVAGVLMWIFAVVSNFM